MKVETLHIANTNFEFELSNQKTDTLQESFEKHPLVLQLQYLPVLYAKPSDGVVVTHLADDNYIRSFCQSHILPFNTKEPIQCNQIVSWGYSQQIAIWAKTNGLHYEMPSWEIVKLVNGKVFSFENSPKLPNSTLLRDKSELQSWLKMAPETFVLKCSYGVSGRGNLIVNQLNLNRALAFCEKEWNEHRSIIAEPWMERVFDFSTQWQIDRISGIVFVGATVIQNDSRGAYQSTTTGPEEKIFSSYYQFLQEHKTHALSILQKIQEHGYFGPVGIDAMIYRDPSKPEKLCLHPIVEVNARQTMSLVALLFQRKSFPLECISVSYTKTQKDRQGLLPEALSLTPDRTIHFSRQFYVNELYKTA